MKVLLLLLLTLLPSATSQNNATSSCGGQPCNEPDVYCYMDTEANITECIPTTYVCGAKDCPNNPDSFCDIDSGTCKLSKWVCEGVTTVEQTCGDGTSWKRWTLSGDRSTVSTATVCGYDDSVCNPEAGGGGGVVSAAVSNNPSIVHALFSAGALAAASASLWFQPFSF